MALIVTRLYLKGAFRFMPELSRHFRVDSEMALFLQITGRVAGFYCL
ncbi:hypothetical protein l11_05820 [Neisseria weaveri LMG 5135]|nr:hypothetical protein l13_13850 [Neisseria weaveri ATCC 51223]EGV38258.1 hypothetical protein l11_05820 [Neisseria weaveri LMG 5135]